MLNQPIDTEMSPTASLALSLFLGSAMCGWSLYELYRRNKESEQQLKELDENLTEIVALQKLHQEVLEETDRRIREKKDIDESEDLEENKYQAWKGLLIQENLVLGISIVREKESSVGKNLAWTSWSGNEDGSCVVRNFYLGNASPMFDWAVSRSNEGMRCVVEETMINGWDSIVKLEISLVVDSEDRLFAISGETAIQTALNGTLKLLLPKVEWARILVDAY